MSLLKSLMAAAFAVLLLSSAAAPAPHALNQSYIYLRIDQAQIEGRIEINLEDLNRAIGTEFREDLTVTEEEVASEIERIEDYLYPRIGFALDGKELALERNGFGLYESVERQFVSCKYVLQGVEGIPQSLEITHKVMFDTDAEHRGFVVIEHFFDQGTFNNEGNVSLIFNPDETTQTLDLTGGSRWQGIKAIIKEGIHHILIGHDHILFLIVLLLTSVVRREGMAWEPRESFGSALWQVLGIVTVFTVAHSVTLSIAAMDLIAIPSKWIESIIALSIAIAALDILFPIFKGRIFLIIAVFGLFHGFGFANVLEPLKVQGSDLVLSLFGFNVGVEIGQVMIVLVAFPILFFLRKLTLYTRFGIYVGALLAGFVGVYWFIERAFEVDLTLGEKLGPLLDLFR